MEDNQKNIDEFIEEHSWLIRPCVLYNEEYKDCTSIKARIHQRFVYGSFTDCTDWKRDYDNCVRWKDDGNKKACKELLESLLKRRLQRLKAHMENDIWKKRDTPPKDWDEPLPSWMEERLKNSFLAVKSKDAYNPDSDRTFCVIM